MFENLINDNGYKAQNQYVIKTDKGTFFKSYNSVCAKWTLDKEGLGTLELSDDAFYSRTTMKHLLIFIRKFTDFRFNRPQDVRDAVNAGIITTQYNNFNPW